MGTNRIGQLRREKGLNQRELGEQLGVGQTAVSAWETGRNEPDYDSLRKMAELFEVGIDYLMGYNNDHIVRGLTREQFEAVQERLRREAEEDERTEIERQIKQQELYERGLTEEEIEELEEQAAYNDWQRSGKHVQFETHQVVQIMESMSKKQRQAALAHVKVITEFGG